METKFLKIVAIFPLKNEIELVEIGSGVTYYWKLHSTNSVRKYSVGQVYEQDGVLVHLVDSDFKRTKK